MDDLARLALETKIDQSTACNEKRRQSCRVSAPRFRSMHDGPLVRSNCQTGGGRALLASVYFRVG